jgi:tRNA-splicing ligase RtcB (3'-phosphate/5'-hydroxy nucleic acid ligase)
MASVQENAMETTIASSTSYEFHPAAEVDGVAVGVPVKAWTRGVAAEPEAIEQLRRTARLPIVHGWVAAMPDVHVGIGATIGSVVPTLGAVIPAAVGVDIGCGMSAVCTSLMATDLPTSLKGLRKAIEMRVPVGRGSFRKPPEGQQAAWARLGPRYAQIIDKRPNARVREPECQLGTLGTGNHFVEVCLDEVDRVWFMLHSGSRGLGNRIGQVFIELAREDMEAHQHNLPDRDLSYFTEGTEHFTDYVEAVSFAQEYAAENRRLMMRAVIDAAVSTRVLPPFEATLIAVDCHHNYVARERHFGADVLVTRKGAVRAGLGELGIIPGSMGARSFIVRGLGNPESFESCSHGAGRALSRTAARKSFTVAEHEEATRGIECRKDAGVLDETPGAYKPIEDVMRAQRDLVEIVHTLRQIVCVKG